ncbi:hypothetical protein MRX96_019402 [Rhipicephalus microplus]
MCVLFSLLAAYFLFFLFITDLRGLLCHSDADGFLRSVIPNNCDFVMVDVPLLPPQRHPLYSYMTTIIFNPASLESHILRHVRTAPDTPLLLVVKRSVLHSTAFSPQAVIRGIFQKVVDMKGHGVVLGDHQITDADTADIKKDVQPPDWRRYCDRWFPGRTTPAQSQYLTGYRVVPCLPICAAIPPPLALLYRKPHLVFHDRLRKVDRWPILERTLSDEVQAYHGLIRYDLFSGNRSALRTLMLDVARMSSVTFVYRMSGIGRTFTHLYFDNFYSMRMNEQNLSSLIDRDLIQPMRRQVGSKPVAISMTMMARRCPKGTVVTFDSHVTCVEIPLNLTQVCATSAAYIQCHHYSAMTRHYGDDNNVEGDVFFELEGTFSAKVHLILTQLKQAGLSPAAFILERYDLDTPSEIRFYDDNTGRDVECTATPFGFTVKTKEKLSMIS